MKTKMILAAFCAACACVAMADAMARNPDVRTKNVLVLGDSISDKHHIGCETNYWGFLSERYGFTPFVYAINGQQMSHIPAQAQKFRKENPDTKVDVVLIFAGTNDYNSGVPLGEWYSFTPEAVATLALPDIERAAPGFVDRLIHGEQHRQGVRVLSCEKKFRKLPDAEIVP